MTNCPLCKVRNFKLHFEQKSTKYYICNNCDLIFQDRNSILSIEKEKDRYLKHENSELTEGYKKFLEKITKPVLEMVSKKDHGLDFGSGPYPMMGEVLRKEGLSLDEYDPIFNPINIKKNHYDFIIICEVIEHINDLYENLNKLIGLAKKHSLFFIQTALHDDITNFESWWYKNDETHISFFSQKTFHFICKEFGFQLVSLKDNVVILNKVDN